jgi:dTDP-glucose 4,6-dehydratase
MDNRSRTVLVTGGAGFIGGDLITRLLATPDQTVVCIDKLTYSANRSRLTTHIAAGLDFHPLDLAEADAVEEVVARSNPNVIFHLAAESHVDRSIDGPAPFIDTNVVGTLNLLQASLVHWRSLPPARAAAFRLVHVSTDEVFGSADADTFFTEQTRYDPRSPYSASKAAADHLVRAWHSTYGLPTVVTTTSNNYGPFQFPEKLIPHTVVRALTGESIAVYGDGQHVRDWIHVSDHVDGLIRAGEQGQGGDSFLFGARNAITNLDLVRRICSILDEVAPDSASHHSRIEFVEDRPGHDRRYAIDPTRAEQSLGWRPQVDFDRGLREVVKWYVDNESWWRQIISAGYRTDRLGVAT